MGLRLVPMPLVSGGRVGRGDSRDRTETNPCQKNERFLAKYGLDTPSWCIRGYSTNGSDRNL